MSLICKIFNTVTTDQEKIKYQEVQNHMFTLIEEYTFYSFTNEQNCYKYFEYSLEIYVPKNQLKPIQDNRTKARQIKRTKLQLTHMLIATLEITNQVHILYIFVGDPVMFLP